MSKFTKLVHTRDSLGLISQLIAIMKRKLDEHDVPTGLETKDASNQSSNFGSLGLDARLLQGVAQQNFFTPTLVQSKAIPLFLEGKDILGMITKPWRKDTPTDSPRPARSKTGSGKTAAYVLPILQSILHKKPVCDHTYLHIFHS